MVTPTFIFVYKTQAKSDILILLTISDYIKKKGSIIS